MNVLLGGVAMFGHLEASDQLQAGDECVGASGQHPDLGLAAADLALFGFVHMHDGGPKCWRGGRGLDGRRSRVLGDGVYGRACAGADDEGDDNGEMTHWFLFSERLIK